jgi:hypothetical protein
MRFSGVGVDAGLIMICDEKYYEKYGYKFEERLSQKRKVKNGKYLCKWNIPDTYNGDVEGEDILEVTSGTIIVSDPCYCIEESNWDKFLDVTNFCENPEPGTVVLDKMGGDGVFTIYVDLEKIGE